MKKRDDLDLNEFEKILKEQLAQLRSELDSVLGIED